MFFILSKILAFLIKPLVWISLALFLGIKHRSTRKGRNWLLFTFFLVWFFTNTLVFESVMRRWEMRSSTLKPCYDYGVVLGGMAYYNEEIDQITFLRSADRLWQAVSEYRKGRVRKLFISGGSGSLLHTEKELEAEMLRNYLIEIGIPAHDILYECKSQNTFENVKFTLESIPNDSSTQILLFTSAFHLKRAKACFQRQGIIVDVFATDSYVSRPRNLMGQLFVPNDEVLRGWTILCKEITGYIVYRLVGYA